MTRKETTVHNNMYIICMSNNTTIHNYIKIIFLNLNNTKSISERRINPITNDDGRMSGPQGYYRITMYISFL